jgi:hypothetical protein
LFPALHKRWRNINGQDIFGHLNLITEEIKATIKARDDAIKKNEPLRNEVSNKDKQLMKELAALKAFQEGRDQDRE